MEILSQREFCESVGYSLEFNWLKGGGGFSFLCDENGTVTLAELQPAARKNYLDCASGVLAVTPGRVQRRVSRWTEPAVGKCEVCGAEVILERFTCTCECGADYNSSGQRLAPRCQWGEETGESVADILSVDSGQGGW